MMSLSSTIKKQRHHAERAIWYIAYDFKKEKQNQPEGDGRAAVGLYFGGKQMGTWSFPNKRILETIHETPACVKGITIEYYIF